MKGRRKMQSHIAFVKPNLMTSWERSIVPATLRGSSALSGLSLIFNAALRAAHTSPLQHPVLLQN